MLFFLFCFVEVTFSFYLRLDYNKELKAALVPYTGWGFGNGYLFPLFYIPFMLFSSRASETKTLALLRCTVLLLMLLQVYDGIRDYLSATPEDYVNSNPYLRYDTLTPIYTIAIPAFWSLLMVLMLVRAYVKYKATKSQTRTT